MNIKENIIKPNSEAGSGRVKQYVLSKGRKVTQITTFCPDIIGPGPAHIYVIEDEALIMVDTGIPTHMAKKIFYYWRNQPIPQKVKDLPDDYSETELITGLKAAGYSLKDIEFIIITHGHPDHYLLGNTIVEKSRARVSSHVMDTDRICNPWAISKSVFEGRPRYEAFGMPLPKSSAYEYHKEAVQESFSLSLTVDYPIAMDGFLSLDGLQSDFIRVKHSPGHSPGSICLGIGSEEDEERILICGDVLLYPITPHPNDLVTYLRTLDNLKQLEKIVLSLPAHGRNIRDFYGRIDFLKKHHRSRLEFTYNACRKPKTPWEIASTPQYFDVFVDPAKFNPMAGNEAFVHIRLLEMAKGLCRSNIAGGVHYFKNTGERFDHVYRRILEIIDDGSSTVL
ncbi:MAG: MBL fold metallo-hydrolase [Deltaproteobacteria bacterium]|jgi:glyoxylase-like metal-dependent hydrolase (beta-lactamase superfamily II)|nr:MAG: MBL fold metallo-hydrolase [Deltaproteobacteria bacterium]